MEKILKNKKVIIGIIIILLIILALALMNKTSNKKEVLLNENSYVISHTESGIIRDEEFEGIKFTNISLITDGDYTTFTSDVTNISNNDLSLEKVHVLLKDREGKVLSKLVIYIPGGLKKDEVKTIKASTLGRFEDVISKEIVK